MVSRVKAVVSGLTSVSSRLLYSKVGRPEGKSPDSVCAVSSEGVFARSSNSSRAVCASVRGVVEDKTKEKARIRMCEVKNSARAHASPRKMC